MKNLLSTLLKYLDAVTYLKDGPLSITDLRQKLAAETDMAESSSFRYVKELSQLTDSFFTRNEGILSLDMDRIRSFMSEMEALFGLPDSSGLVSNLQEKDKQLSQIKEQIGLLQEELREKTELLHEQERKTATLDEQLSSLQHQYDSLKNRNLKFNLDKDTILINTVQAMPVNSVIDTLFIKDPILSIFQEPGEIQVSGTYKEKTEGEPTGEKGEVLKQSSQLNAANVRKRSFLKIVTDKLLRKKAAELKENKSKEKSENGKNEQETHNHIEEKIIDPEEKQRREKINELLKSEVLTNQEKLAVYAFIGRTRSSEMDHLLQIAIDHGLYANAVIEILEESSGKGYADLKDLLFTLSGSSEYMLKQSLAEELIAGKWYIVAVRNGIKTKFQLVPIEEFNEIREALGLKQSSYTYEKLPDTDAEDRKEPEETIPTYIMDAAAVLSMPKLNSSEKVVEAHPEKTYFSEDDEA